MPHSLESLIKIAPTVWPGHAVEVQPGDLTKFAPTGFGMSGPFPIRPWDDPFGPSPARFYGFQAPSGNPFSNAPMSSGAGGVIYFDSGIVRPDFDTLLRLLGVYGAEKNYAVFLGEAKKPKEERYLTQIRIVSADALHRMFNVEGLPETLAWVQQTIPLNDLLWRFIEMETETWGFGMSPTLSGLFGGDGDWAKEKLCFGLMVENNDQGVYRFWSRAWLVTK